LGLAAETTEATLSSAVSAKLGLSVPAGSVDASEPNIYVRGQLLVDAVELAFESQPLFAGLAQPSQAKATPGALVAGQHHSLILAGVKRALQSPAGRSMATGRRSAST
jgi:hypothetical protein